MLLVREGGRVKIIICCHAFAQKLYQFVPSDATCKGEGAGHDHQFLPKICAKIVSVVLSDAAGARGGGSRSSFVVAHLRKNCVSLFEVAQLVRERGRAKIISFCQKFAQKLCQLF